MARRVGHRHGGIFGLLELIGQHQEAVEFELLAHGFRLRDVGSEAFNWRDLYVLVRRWQKQPGNALAEGVQGHPVWTVAEQILAIIADVLAYANWQRLKKRSAPKPKRLPRPWEKKRSRQLGSDPIPISSFDGWWDSKAKARGTHGRHRTRYRVDPSRPDR